VPGRSPASRPSRTSTSCSARQASSRRTEKVDQLSVYEFAHGLKQPKLPVTYLFAAPSTWTVGPPKYNAVIHDQIAGYVNGFKPGTLKKVQSPHYMESAVSPRIAEEIDLLIGRL